MILANVGLLPAWALKTPRGEAHPVRPPLGTSPVGPAAPHAPTDTQETLAIMFASDAIMTELRSIDMRAAIALESVF